MPLNDLTGTVRTTQPCYFACGQLAEIWMAEYSRGRSKITVRAITTFPQSMTDPQAQVAVKMIRGRASSTTNDFERLDAVSALQAFLLFTHASLGIATGGKTLESAQPPQHHAFLRRLL
jgi:hypothetical protein